MPIPLHHNLEYLISRAYHIQAFELDPLHESNAGAEVAHVKKFNWKGA